MNQPDSDDLRRYFLCDAPILVVEPPRETFHLDENGDYYSVLHGPKLIAIDPRTGKKLH